MLDGPCGVHSTENKSKQRKSDIQIYVFIQKIFLYNLISQAANFLLFQKQLEVIEKQLEVVERNRIDLPLPLISCDSWISSERKPR